MKKYWKWYFLPSPRELGMSDSNALPSKFFRSNGDTSPTWEDWEEKVKKDYPVRYFLVESVVPWCKTVYRRYISDPVYWLKCHILPRYRYHMLDLRQPKKDVLAYRFGWIDSDTKMLYALFKILNDFVKNEMPHWYCPTEDEVKNEPVLAAQRNAYLEVQAIHHWWNVERHIEDEAHNNLLAAWSDSRIDEDNPSTRKLWNDLNVSEKSREDKTEEMVQRLLKVRHFMWT